MKKQTIAILLTVFSSISITQAEAPVGERIERENIEWCDVWIASAGLSAKPRVLLVGDSITKGYYDSVNKLVSGEMYCGRLATSACVADPAFLAQLGSVLGQYHFDVIHFNNGLHGFAYTEAEYRDGYERALKIIKEKSPSATLVLALSTPLQETSDKNDLNPRIVARNEIVKELAETYSAKISDLHSISKGHPEYYRDPYHYLPVAIELQAKKVSEILLDVLDSEKTKAGE